MPGIARHGDMEDTAFAGRQSQWYGAGGSLTSAGAGAEAHGTAEERASTHTFNVGIVLWMVFFYNIVCTGIEGSVLTMYLFILSGDNELVGLVLTVTSVSALVALPIVACLTDGMDRYRLAFWQALVNTCAFLLLAYAVYTDWVSLIVFAMPFNGMSHILATTVRTVLLIDNAPDVRDRTRLLSKRTS
eukprot:CAMPEP_0198492408 /NCGR_PEP_ID=MMETSP1462-20131121/3411_1 /TAXON_ID=1333877 /ORGANISM="Brandtodinium nutriculum, Strain RCC3387" /LENGTH=187 /DNA_ID=CAMNT_0044221051 /DNA_START=9 /DNA_END=569 /DNA_ORIENTATION=-